MDKKILIALGLIGAFSIDNATGMNGIIENPSVNESQSMKTINDFSYDLKSLGPVKRIFDLTGWYPKKIQEALHEVSEMADFYWTHPDADMTSTAYTYYRLFVYDHVMPDFIETQECDKLSLNTITKIFRMAPRSIGTNLTCDITDKYSLFLQGIDEIGLGEAMRSEDFSNQKLALHNALGRFLYGY